MGINNPFSHNRLIFGQIPTPSCLRVRQEDSNCLRKVLIWKIQWIEAAQALRMTDAQANFYIFQISNPSSVWSWVELELSGRLTSKSLVSCIILCTLSGKVQAICYASTCPQSF